ncbi:pyridoxine kinase [Lactonifactor longoviformis]|uniref:pyridoxal kinase n=1 Tax=Lactonifactor longoviformis DSM 17459 TaxID=1122155 RepID=A0A1M5AUH3_9CLOT|nr:pyridoxamine kinase [Lactonifactor longoviformis]POP33588.1 pyridoxine kinase [Lactonifactor longoviformis]SHF33592.1 pyridoxine kinase [Lactonifactor longoviformis DSM 17459]
MTKKIAVINDLSGFGRCSLTAAISVLSAMGVQACPLPTALLTAQTGYPSYYCDDYTDKMEHYRREWNKMQVNFTGIYTGYVANERQIHEIFSFLDTFYQKETFLLVDPVMGDNGHTYGMYNDELCRLMRLLAAKADLITPNLTELCLLSGTDFHDLPESGKPQALLDTVREMAQALCEKGTKSVVVTGIHFQDLADGSKKIGNLYVSPLESGLASFPDMEGSFSGTGDLFASVLAGGYARGDSLSQAVLLAGSFLEDALRDSVREGIPYNDGVNFEKYLYYLLPKQ